MYLCPTDLKDTLEGFQKSLVSNYVGCVGISSKLIKSLFNLLYLLFHWILFIPDKFPLLLSVAIVNRCIRSDPQVCDKYKPISLPSPFSKVFENVVAKRLLFSLILTTDSLKISLVFRKTKTLWNTMFFFVNKVVESLDNTRQDMSLIFIWVDLQFTMAPNQQASTLPNRHKYSGVSIVTLSY